MRSSGVPAVALLLILSTFTLQVWSAEDIYWEGELDESREFLEVNENTGLGHHFTRLKRDLWDWLKPTVPPTTTASPDDFDGFTEDTYNGIENPDEKEDEAGINEGSGFPDRVESDYKEKTVRATFVVMEPYLKEYSSRDSVQFQNFSKSLADAVNLLYEGLPGTHRASLVRIQSRISDEFSCKVTLDIMTTYEDTNRIAQILQDHIRNRMSLGNIKVNVDGFKAVDVDPETIDECAPDELKCDDGRCIPGTTRCDSRNDCPDGRDELGCPHDPEDRDLEQTQDINYPGQNVNENEIPSGPLESENNVRGDDLEETEDPEISIDSKCASDEFQCDQNRCITTAQVCDGRSDCFDGTDESLSLCSERCGVQDFRCPSNNMCIKASSRCDRVFDCPNKEDEQNCACTDDEFKCANDGSCIELRKRCDGVNNCDDSSDEANCACSSDQWQCDLGSCIKRAMRCDGRVDCPTDRSDERNCLVADYFKCRSGKLIPAYLRCNRNYDCPSGDYSDEQNCPCGDGDFQCDNGYCIPASKHCDRSHDCQDGSDEQDCTYGSICMAYQYKCSSGQCVASESYCNGTAECDDGSDEQSCPCKRDEHKCRNGSCINAAKVCDGRRDCGDGDDELHCETCSQYHWQCKDGSCIPLWKYCDGQFDCRDRSDEKYCHTPRQLNKASACPPDLFSCPGPELHCVQRCNYIPECPGGEDEDDCKECNHNCDGRCLDDSLICNSYPDCSDGSDELNCDSCDTVHDFRCQNGECLNIEQRCNGLVECDDSSDEENCTETITAEPHTCAEDQFECYNRICINKSFHCDGNYDCADKSDELHCAWYGMRARSPRPVSPCLRSEFTCAGGRCIPHSRRCDNIYDCSDFSDEQNCHNYPECGEGYFKCLSGQCIRRMRYCDGIDDCDDGSDENDCVPEPEPEPEPVTERNPDLEPNTDRYPGSNPLPVEPYPTDYNPLPVEPYPPDNNNPLPVEPYPPYPYPDTTPYPFLPPITTTTRSPPIYTTRGPYPNTPGYRPPDFRPDGCNRYQWRCENGPCIDIRQRCDGHINCPYDNSDELDCPPPSRYPESDEYLKLKTYPNEQTIRKGGDVVFTCRDEGPLRAQVRWARQDGRPLPPDSVDRRGRLELYHVTESDSGVYVCQAPSYMPRADAEISVTLNIVPDQENDELRPFTACKAYEATCGNGQCIPRSAVCDGKIDCSDKSDEDSCNLGGKCEPNTFQCANRKCVLKTWLCDSEDDCGDGSDEDNCGQSQYGDSCRPVEFACHNNSQCVPKSFHCDGQSDCLDKSDELGCTPVYVTMPPKPANLRLQIGETLTLRCTAVGVPTPLISWRLNWGHVPEKCTTTNSNGDGTLTCPNMQIEDRGAYSCEAINNRGSSFAQPDAIVFVEGGPTSDVCPRGYFNSEAQSESDCIQCFCFGESTQCHSADLFIYNMPTPLGQGGTKLVGVAQTYNGDVQLDPQPITDRYYYQPLMNGATVIKIETYGARGSNSHPYLTLPESYNDNQLTSYGGYIRYKLSPHYQAYDNYNSGVPDIIIKGKYVTLVYTRRPDNAREVKIEARLVPGDWQKASPRGLTQATREDIMMSLDQIEMVLLRADSNDAGVNITDFVMESAQSINSGLGAASLVEECVCPPGYGGLSCQKCLDGYVRDGSSNWLGNCVPEPKECPPGTYGDPSSGYACRPCPCPLTNRENQFARTCSLGPRGVVCDCQVGYEGDHCERCAPGYEGNPMIRGDSCRPARHDNCNRAGTDQVLPNGECVCKPNVQGRYCDQCSANSFHLSADNSLGCTQCFCTAETNKCTSSTLRRKKTTASFNVPSIVDEVHLYNSAPVGMAGVVRYNAPVETDIQPRLYQGSIYAEVDLSKPTVYYWSMPAIFGGDKLTSYGGYLTYILRNVPTNYNPGDAADVQLISDNHLKFNYFGNFAPSSDGILNATVRITEDSWQRTDGKEVSRPHFLLALADVKTILIKATYANQMASIVSASIDTAEANGGGPQAVEVEQCACPVGFIGTSCEDCAPGYTRSSIHRGLYLEKCEPCYCNNNSRNCHPETGVCYDCAGNTAGEKCDRCRFGYERDAYFNCVPSRQQPQCECDPRGTSSPCDPSSPYCSCKQNVEGERCDRCRAGTFGLDEANPRGCSPCYCSGATSDCHAGSQYSRIAIPAPVIGEDYGGFRLMSLNDDVPISKQYVPVADQSELMYIFSGGRPEQDLYWSLPDFSGNRLLSYGGNLEYKLKYETGGYPEQVTSHDNVVLVGEHSSLSWSSPEPMTSGQAAVFKVPLREDEWFVMDSGAPVGRHEFMDVLKNVRRVLVKATVSENIASTSIADVSMDTATDKFAHDARSATDIEICMCPEGHTGTSCETCSSGYYADEQGYCKRCRCNGFECQLTRGGEVTCNCPPQFTGPDCSTVGLIMELHPSIEEGEPSSFYRKVTLVCKYRAPEALTIQFYHEDKPIYPAKRYNESVQSKDGWHGESVWTTKWDTRRRGEAYECHTITQKGLTLGVLTTSLSDSVDETTTPPPEPSTEPPPPPPPTLVVEISHPTIRILEVGSSVNFTCRARSRMTASRIPVTWSKVDGYLPLGRSVVDSMSGVLIITNLQISDSGVYRCQANDGVNTQTAEVTVKVPGNPMIAPVVQIEPSVQEVYVGERVQLLCVATGNPTPTISWQRTGNRALPVGFMAYGDYLIIDNAQEDDSGEYRCVATNLAGYRDAIAMVTIHPRSGPSEPPGKLSVSSTSPNVQEGESTRVVCTGTANIPAGAIGWTRQDGTTFESNVRSENGVLYIDVARLTNEGVYVCQAAAPNTPPVPVLVTVQALTPTDEPTTNITVPVTSLSIPTGGTGSVDCIPSGYPLPVISWTKYNEEMGRSTTQRDNTLIIANAQESDAGYYLCNGLVDGEPKQSVYVYVAIEKREIPTVEIYPKEVEHTVRIDSVYELQCRVSGNPEPVITWHRSDNRPLTQNTQITDDNRILRFEKVDVNDEGEYTCTAENSAGSRNASALIRVRSIPVITITPQEFIEAVYGEPVTAECRASGYPLPMVSIRLLNAYTDLVPPSPGIAVLRIGSSTETDEGVYLCKATNGADEMTNTFEVRVNRGDNYGGGERPDEGNNNYPTEGPPRPNGPITLIALVGQDASIRCDTNDGSEIRWRRMDQQLASKAMEIGNELIIPNASKSDTGTYACVLFNPFSGEQKMVTTELRVVAAPSTKLVPPNKTWNPGQSPSVECQVEGDDIRSVTWRSVGKPMSRRAEVRDNFLIFHDIQPEDAGIYECIAISDYGNATGTAEVFVNDRTLPPARNPNEQRARVGSTVRLNCNVPVTATVTAPRVEWTKDGGPLPRSVRRMADNTLVINYAKQQDSGRYLCIIRDNYGRDVVNYIDLYIDGVECGGDEFLCHDGNACVDLKTLCDTIPDCEDNSDEENCMQSEIVSNFNGTRPEAESLIAIDNPPRAYAVGEDLTLTCRSGSRDTSISWEKLGTNEYVQTRDYSGGSVLVIKGVQETDAGVYRCTGRNGYRESFYDYRLEVQPASGGGSPYPNNENEVRTISARLRDSIDLPCMHDVSGPVAYEWRREPTALPAELRTDEQTLHLESISETDAGTYTCRVTGAGSGNRYASAQARLVLHVKSVVPQFGGDSWLALPTIKDAYGQFNVEISFKPTDYNGLLLYNSENQGRTGDYIALRLVDGVPQFVMNTTVAPDGRGAVPVVVYGDRPLELNVWHTARINRINSKVSMAIDNTGLFTNESREQWEVLDLNQPLYMGGVPDYEQLPEELARSSGFVGCVSMLILGTEEKNIMLDSTDKYQVTDCDNCSPNPCINNGVCQEARNELGYICLCPAGFPGRNCDRTGESCRAGLCGEGKCTDTADGYKCSCPITFTGKNCEHQQYIEFPAFTGSAFLAIKAPKPGRMLRVSMKIKPSAPVTDGIIMYCAESPLGLGGFTSLTVHDGRLEFRYDVGDGTGPAIVTAQRRLAANEVSEVHISRLGPNVTMKINSVEEINSTLASRDKALNLDTPMFVGGVDDSITLNRNIGVMGGFYGCIIDVKVYGNLVDLVNSSIMSANVQDCSNYDRGDIPESESICKLCRNGGRCTPDGGACACRPGFAGRYCETQQSPAEPCANQPCRNGGTCRPSREARANYTCDCPLHYTGPQCNQPLELLYSLGLNGNGYLELPAALLQYNQVDETPAVIAMAFNTRDDGLLFYQRETDTETPAGDYLMIRVEDGFVTLDWNAGSGSTRLRQDSVYVTDGNRHSLVAILNHDSTVSLQVDGLARNGSSVGISSYMNADSNIYIGGMPSAYNVYSYHGFTGCIEQIELNSEHNRQLNLGAEAVAGKNIQQCTN